MKILEILYISNYPIDMVKNDIIKQYNLTFKKELKELNALVFENDNNRKIYYIQSINSVLKFIRYRLFDEIINIKLMDKDTRRIIKQSLR